MRTKLFESAPVIYVDKKTGKRYQYQNGKFVEIKPKKSKKSKSTGSSSNSATDGDPSGGSDDDSKPDNETSIGKPSDTTKLDQEDKDREEKIKKEKEQTSAGDGNGSDEEESEQDKEARLERIRRMFDDDSMAAEATDEAERAVSKERSRRAAANVKRYYQNNQIRKFEDDLRRFIKNEIAADRNSSWRKFNKSYVGTGIMRPGRATVKNKNIPLINVYFDRSGSWDGDKTKVGVEAIGTLRNYEKKGQIKIEIYYFGVRVSEIDSRSATGGGTLGQPILDHIKQTGPDNVIVMTDSDITDCSSNVEVPGAVWFLWKGGVSNNLKSHLSGVKQTNSYELE